MTDSLKIFCINLGTYIPFSGGETLDDIASRLGDRLGFTPVCARVNNKVEDLVFTVFTPKQVEFLPYGSPEGKRCHTASLCMVLYRAVESVAPGSVLTISHSVCGGLFCRIDGLAADDANAGLLRREMARLIAEDHPIERRERPTEDVIRMFASQGLEQKVKLLHTLHELYTVYYRLDGLADTCQGPLLPRTGMIRAFDIVTYRDGFLLLGADPADPSRVAPMVPQPKVFEAFVQYKRFNRIIGISNAGDVNEIVEKKEDDMMVNVAEALHNKYIREIADTITSRHRDGGARVVLIAGPSSSGKTTFTKRLSIELLTNLIKPVMISLDDYFVDRHRTPLDENGEKDYESLFALDLELFNDHLNRLIAGEEVELPYYNFEKGEREFRGHRISLQPDTILLIEGIHGLNPQLTEGVEERMKYRVYVSALSSITIDNHNWVSTTDNRLLRRMIRDYKYRGTSPIDTIARWPSVRRGEEKWIFPYQENADSIFNSSLLFELGVIRDEAERVLRTVPRDRVEYATAHRLRRFLNYFAPIPSRVIPPTSLLREFLGGSSFHY
ncbi:MAG: nucleoside kinase [Muribaculaceae bacterium]|nr:nucleoside kinase [Muribaculaceae bacterium]